MNKITNLLVLCLIFCICSCDDRTHRTYEVVDEGLEMAQDTSTTIYERQSKYQDFKTVDETLNRKVIYLFKKDSTGKLVEKMAVFRYEDQGEFIKVSIKNDTVNLTEKFEGYVSFSPIVDDYELKIYENGSLKAVNKKNFFEGNYHHRFSPQSSGLYEFKGLAKILIKNKWQEHPFRYKYFVK